MKETQNNKSLKQTSIAPLLYHIISQIFPIETLLTK